MAVIYVYMVYIAYTYTYTSSANEVDPIISSMPYLLYLFIFKSALNLICLEFVFFSLFIYLSDQSGGQRRSPAVVHSQTPRGLDPEARPLASAPSVHPEALQLLRLGDGGGGPASGSRGCQPVKRTCLVQHSG